MGAKRGIEKINTNTKLVLPSWPS